MQVCHRFRRQCTLFVVNHAGHADWTFPSPKRRNRLPARNTQEVRTHDHQLVGMRSSAVRSVHPTSRQRLRKIDGDETFTRERICRDTNTVYELQGCIWHGHRCWMTKKYNGVNPVNGKNLSVLYQHARDKIQYIKDQGYNVVEM